MQPSGEVRNELRSYLAIDSSRVGEVYRLLEEELAPDAIAERLEGGAAGAWQYRRMVRALLDGNLPSSAKFNEFLGADEDGDILTVPAEIANSNGSEGWFHSRISTLLADVTEEIPLMTATKEYRKWSPTISRFSFYTCTIVKE